MMSSARSRSPWSCGCIIAAAIRIRFHRPLWPACRWIRTRHDACVSAAQQRHAADSPHSVALMLKLSVRLAAEILCCLSSYFHPLRVERLTRLQDTVGEMDQLPHRRADHRHLALAALAQAIRPSLK